MEPQVPQTEKPVQKIEITHKTILFTGLLLMGGYLTYLVLDIMALLFVSLLLMASINPLVAHLYRHGIPRILSIILVYALFMGTMITGVGLVVPPLASQLSNLMSQVTVPPEILDQLDISKLEMQDWQLIASQVNSVPRLLSIVGSAFSVVFVILTVTMITFYLLLERPQLHKGLIVFFGFSNAEAKAERFVNKLETQIGSWVRGQAILMLVVGLMTFVGLVVLGVPYAVPLSILAGFLEVIPNLGPMLSAVPAIAVALLMGNPAQAIGVTILYILVQQLENNFIVPVVMRHSVGVNPVFTIIALLIGFRLGGVFGAVFAIPLYLTAKVIMTEYVRLKEENGGI